MYNVKLDFYLSILECPKAGLAAIDFRRMNNLKERPDNRVCVCIDRVAEEIVRALPTAADHYADINSDSWAEYVLAGAGPVITTNGDKFYWDGGNAPNDFPVPMQILRPHMDSVDASDTDVIELLKFVALEIRNGYQRYDEIIAARRQAELDSLYDLARAGKLFVRESENDTYQHYLLRNMEA